MPAPGKSPVGPFAFGDEEYVRELLEAAGLRHVPAVPHEITVRAPPSAVVDPARCSASWASRRPGARRPRPWLPVTSSSSRWGRTSYEFPLAFMVYEADGIVAVWRATAGPRCPRSLGSPRARRLRSSVRPRAWSTDLPAGVTVKRQARGKADVVVAFFVDGRTSSAGSRALAKMIFPAGGLWVAWPKRASGLETTMHEDVVREVALPLGLVDNKVCAIDETWSGLRVVWRRRAPDVTSRA